MDPVSSEIVSYTIGKALDVLSARVLQRWSKYRAEGFMRSFIEAVRAPDQNSEETERLLTRILDNDTASEILFESYRLVCLSRSKDIGPRAIGLLTAKIIAENRSASEIEELWFHVYETLSDGELIAAYQFYADAFRRAREAKDDKYELVGDALSIIWNEESSEFKAASYRDPINLGTALGFWAAMLGNLGIMSTETVEEVWDYSEDSERHVDEPGTARKLTWKITLRTEDEEYAALIDRARVIDQRFVFGQNT
jgi:hypothetical protein